MTAPVLVGTVAVNLLAQQFRVAVPVTNALDAIASRPLGLFIPILAAVSVLSHLELGGPARRVPDLEKRYGSTVVCEYLRGIDMADGNSRIGRRRGSVVAAASSHEAEHALAARYPRVVPDHVRLASVMPAKQLVTPIVGNIVGTAAYHERVVERVELVARTYRPQSSPVVVLFAVRVDVILLEPYLLDRISDLVQNRYRAEKPGPRVIEHHLPSPEVDFTDMPINQLFFECTEGRLSIVP